MNENKCATTERPMSQTIVSLEQMQDIIEALDKRVSILKERLNPVLTPDMPKGAPTDGINPSKFSVDLAITIDTKKNRLQNILNSVDEMLNRLEL
jgi:hypothetical protein